MVERRGLKDSILQIRKEVKRMEKDVSLPFSVINIMNISGDSKKTDPLRKFKSGTSDKSDSKVEKVFKDLCFSESDGCHYIWTTAILKLSKMGLSSCLFHGVGDASEKD